MARTGRITTPRLERYDFYPQSPTAPGKTDFTPDSVLAPAPTCFQQVSRSNTWLLVPAVVVPSQTGRAAALTVPVCRCHRVTDALHRHPRFAECQISPVPGHYPQLPQGARLRGSQQGIPPLSSRHGRAASATSDPCSVPS